MSNTIVIQTRNQFTRPQYKMIKDNIIANPNIRYNMGTTRKPVDSALSVNAFTTDYNLSQGSSKFQTKYSSKELGLTDALVFLNEENGSVYNRLSTSAESIELVSSIGDYRYTMCKYKIVYSSDDFIDSFNNLKINITDDKYVRKAIHISIPSQVIVDPTTGAPIIIYIKTTYFDSDNTITPFEHTQDSSESTNGYRMSNKDFEQDINYIGRYYCEVDKEGKLTLYISLLTYYLVEVETDAYDTNYDNNPRRVENHFLSYSIQLNNNVFTDSGYDVKNYTQGRSDYTLESNELVSNENANKILEKVYNQYRNGKRVVTLVVFKDNYYDTNGNLVYNKDSGDTIKVGDYVYINEIKNGREVSLGTLGIGEPIKFLVTSSEISYTGGIKINLQLNEV